ncbi:MAG: tRNA 2-thiocytidine biosynthesis protein TtcA [Oscillospiraceae bacterium]|nr:tRNA 2-thiocytidine biosynthesis protein TtcA [Oscillospiraceae bacterium]
MDTLNSLTGMVRRCVDDYNMISPGDRIAVGISGGKDSLVLLAALSHLKRYYPAPFELEAITIDAGFEGMDFSGVEAMCAELGVPYTRVPTDIREIVFEARQESNPCSLCAKMRRGALNTTLKARGCGKLALGHHFDDAVETFAMSLLFEGRLNCFAPVSYMDRMDVTMIRPLLYVGELRSANMAKALSLPVVTSTCPMDRTSRRREVKDLLDTLSAAYPDLRSRIFGAMQRLPLPGWERAGEKQMNNEK